MKKSITRNEWAILILFLAILLGTFVRFNPAILARFAINDGGMFAVMIDDLKANHYLIPAVTSYNHAGIPFAYPPLGFYLGALTSDLFGLDSLQVVQWLPALFASLSIPAFYWLAWRLLKNKYHASLSALFYALTPRAFFWFIMGGGLTRSLGLFFMLLALTFIVRLYEENRRGDILLAGVFSGLAVMSHPEAAAHTFVSAVLLWLVLSRTRRAFINSVYVGLVVLIVSAPWWATVILSLGAGPLLSALQTGSKMLAVFNLLFFAFTDEPYVALTAVLGLIGIAHRLVRRDYLLAIWMAIPFLVVGRSAANLAVIPLAMLAAVGVAEVVFPALKLSVKGDAERGTEIVPVERNVTLYLVMYLLFSAYQFGFQLSGSTLYPHDRVAMKWVRENTPEESKFVVLTGSSSVACDSVQEWFPAMTERKSLYTIQGAEWTLGDGFGAFIKKTGAIQACMSKDTSCLEDEIGTSEYDYVYISKVLRSNNCTPLAERNEFPYFVEQIKNDQGLAVVYETDDVLVMDRR